MNRAWLAALLLLGFAPGQADAWWHWPNLQKLNCHLAGQVVDHTNNHGRDLRIWAPTLQAKRDLYVYLPPGYDPTRHYPILVWLHGINQDEQDFVFRGGIEAFDAAMASGRLPPMMIAVPDGTMRGWGTLRGTNPLFLNSDAGPFEEYLMQDIWHFLLNHYPVLPDRRAHVVGGFSGGGGSAIRLGIKHRQEFGVAFGLLPPLNVRWMDCHGRYNAPFDPNCWGWRTDTGCGLEPIGRFYGVVVIRLKRLVYPLYGRGPEAIQKLSQDNPIEMLDHYRLKPGELAMYVGYGGRDQFNLKAQVDSFLYRACQLGLPVAVGYDPKGTHNWETAQGLLPDTIHWLGLQLAPCCKENVGPVFNRPGKPAG